MTFDVSKGAAYAALYSVLAFFTLLAVASAGWLAACLPKRVAMCCSLGGNTNNSSSSSSNNGGGGGWTTDYFLSARNSASPWAIGLSFFASGMGAWVSACLCACRIRITRVCKYLIPCCVCLFLAIFDIHSRISYTYRSI